MDDGKKPTGALNVRLSLSSLKRALRLNDDVRLVYAGDFDYATQGIKLTFVGEGLPIPQEGCTADEGYISIELDGQNRIAWSELKTYEK